MLLFKKSIHLICLFVCLFSNFDCNLQATMMSGSTLSLGDESEVCNDGETPFPAAALKQCWDCSTKAELNDSNTAVPLELHKV